MKRIASGLALFSLSLLASAVHAQSSVSLYGLVNVGVGSFQMAGQKKLKQETSGDMATSYWGIGGKEDLGGGMKAVFALEGFFLADTGAQGRFSGDTQFARAAWVGLSSDTAGTVRLGRNTNLTFLSLLLFNSFSDSFGFSPTIIQYFTDNRGFGSKLEGDSGWSNSVTYLSPSFGGFSVNLQAAPSEGVGKANYGGNVLYFGGPLSATLSYQSVGSTPTPAAPIATVGNTKKEKTTTGGVAYDFGVVKLFAQYGEIKDDILSTKTKISDVSASAPLGAGKLLLAYGNSKTTPTAGLVTTHKTTTFGYDYNLSKRTDVYAVYMNDKVTNLTNGNTFSIGLKHAF
jgi:predicted porin